jgi:carboxymethylenebutenolidase
MTHSQPQNYLAIPPGGNGRGVLVLHAWRGLNDLFRGFCDRLAQEGFVALAPDLFGGKIARTVEEAEQHMYQWDEAQEVPPILLPAFDNLGSLSAATLAWERTMTFLRSPGV